MVPSILSLFEPSEWDDYGPRNLCWLNHEAEGKGALRVNVYIDTISGIWAMNFGIANRLIRGLLSDEEKQGIIYDHWELSHLCGNWRCVDHNHHIVEPKIINFARKDCFKHTAKPCRHNPPCLIWEHEDDGNHLIPFSNRLFLGNAPFQEFADGSQDQLAIAKEHDKGVEQQDTDAWRLNLLNVYRPNVSETEMDTDNWSEADLFRYKWALVADPSYT